MESQPWFLIRKFLSLHLFSPFKKKIARDRSPYRPRQAQKIHRQTLPACPTLNAQNKSGKCVPLQLGISFINEYGILNRMAAHGQVSLQYYSCEGGHLASD